MSKTKLPSVAEIAVSFPPGDLSSTDAPATGVPTALRTVPLEARSVASVDCAKPQSVAQRLAKKRMVERSGIPLLRRAKGSVNV